MYNCPACGTEIVEARSTCACGADLSLLERLDATADAWFNKALDAADRRATAQALEWISASCAARPTDAAARRVQAKLWAQLGQLDAARDALNRAMEIDPDSPDAILIREALDAADSSNGRASRASKPRPRDVAARQRAKKRRTRR